MKLSRLELETEIHNPESRKYNFIFIGMSGLGKTYWSKRISNIYQYPYIEIDEQIGESEKINALVKDYPGEDLAEKMGNYFGMPWTENYQEKEDVYLSIERQILDTCTKIHTSMFDLAGSAIYHPEEMKKISKTGLVVYLEANPDQIQDMLSIYLKDPKPVCWNKFYRPLTNESKEETLERCYQHLLNDRAGKYSLYADVTIPYHTHRSLAQAEDFMEEIKKQLS